MLTVLVTKVYVVDEIEGIQWDDFEIKVFSSWEMYEEFCEATDSDEWFVSEPDEIELDTFEI